MHGGETVEKMEPMKAMEPMEPMRPMEPIGAEGGWWPEGLGTPSATGSSDGVRYAFFEGARRVAVQNNGTVALHDTEGRRITGLSQSEGIALETDQGRVGLETLPKIG